MRLRGVDDSGRDRGMVCAMRMAMQSEKVRSDRVGRRDDGEAGRCGQRQVRLGVWRARCE